QGRKALLTPKVTQVKAGKEFRFPPQGQTLKARAPGKEQISVLASQEAFLEGELLRGDGVSDRLVHPVQLTLKGQGADMRISPDPVKTVKKTITMEVK